ncbi:hypothetical protein A4X03_0g6697 [Tilletia caries]|uniref:Uncharacterized protein n=1 Tax=Tilletia caries TaxID=13290 RepID=A0A177UAN2_9BASI|nr:hypothetical protein A4X03_0g6697 [Tilletia caries]
MFGGIGNGAFGSGGPFSSSAASSSSSSAHAAHAHAGALFGAAYDPTLTSAALGALGSPLARDEHHQQRSAGLAVQPPPPPPPSSAAAAASTSTSTFPFYDTKKLPQSSSLSSNNSSSVNSNTNTNTNRPNQTPPFAHVLPTETLQRVREFRYINLVELLPAIRLQRRMAGDSSALPYTPPIPDDGSLPDENLTPREWELAVSYLPRLASSLGAEQAHVDALLALNAQIVNHPLREWYQRAIARWHARQRREWVCSLYAFALDKPSNEHLQELVWEERDRAADWQSYATASHPYRQQSTEIGPGPNGNGILGPTSPTASVPPQNAYSSESAQQPVHPPPTAYNNTTGGPDRSGSGPGTRVASQHSHSHSSVHVNEGGQALGSNPAAAALGGGPGVAPRSSTVGMAAAGGGGGGGAHATGMVSNHAGVGLSSQPMSPRSVILSPPLSSLMALTPGSMPLSLSGINGTGTAETGPSQQQLDVQSNSTPTPAVPDPSSRTGSGRSGAGAGAGTGTGGGNRQPALDDLPFPCFVCGSTRGHDHRTCNSPYLFNGQSSITHRVGAEAKVVFRDSGRTACLDFNMAVGCAKRHTHPEREHRCTICGSGRHGLNGCPALRPGHLLEGGGEHAGGGGAERERERERDRGERDRERDRRRRGGPGRSNHHHQTVSGGGGGGTGTGGFKMTPSVSASGSANH